MHKAIRLSLQSVMSNLELQGQSIIKQENCNHGTQTSARTEGP